ncbi:MAG: AAA family ATPase [Patescibacteria group bacterium]
MYSFKKLAEEGKKKSVAKWKENIKLIHFRSLMGIDFPPTQWRINELIPSEGITIISAPPASYKTWLVLQMALDIAQGKSFLGHFGTQLGRVLIVDEENHQRIIQKRLKALGAPNDLPIYFLSQEEFVATQDHMMEGLIEICDEHLIDTVFIDSLVRINRSDENVATKMAGVFRSLRTICKSGRSLIITHHERKEGASGPSSPGSRMRGSSDILAAVDCHLALSRDKDDVFQLMLENTKSRDEVEIKPFEIRVHKDEDRTWFEYIGESTSGVKRKEEARVAILELLEGDSSGMSKTQIVQKITGSSAIGSKNIFSALKELIREGIVEERKGKGNTKLCFLKLGDREAGSKTDSVNG